MVGTDLTDRTVAVTGTGESAGAIHALLSFDALTTRRTTLQSLTEMSGRALAGVDAIDELALTSHDRSGRALEAQTATAS